MNNKRAIIVASFGTSYNETRAKTIDRIEQDIADSFPDWDVKRAFTSKMIIRKLEKRDGLKIDYIDEAIERLIDEGYTEVIIQPTLVMNGIEYEDIYHISHKYKGSFDRISVGTPLLSFERDFDEMTDIIINEFREESKGICGKESALVLMGHGTEHYANGAFPELQLKLYLSDCKDVVITTVEGFPGFKDLRKMVGDIHCKDVALLPLMLVAGDHAINDMAGDEPDSLKSTLTELGYDVHPIVKGIAEYGSIRRMFVRHVREAMESSH